MPHQLENEQVTASRPALLDLILMVGPEGGRDRLGMSAQAWDDIIAQLDAVAGYPPEAFGLRTDGHIDDPPAGRVKAAQQFVRRLAGICYGDVADVHQLAVRVHGLIDPDELTVYDVERIIAPEIENVRKMWHAARLLRAGLPYRDVCDRLDASEWLVRGVQASLGIETWWTVRKARHADRALDEGLTPEQTAAQWNAGNPAPQHVAVRSARRWLADARARRVLAAA